LVLPTRGAHRPASPPSVASILSPVRMLAASAALWLSKRLLDFATRAGLAAISLSERCDQFGRWMLTAR
jgi:hypothetical protein